MKFKLYRQLIIVSGLALIVGGLFLGLNLNPVSAQGPEDFALNHGNFYAGAVASGGDFSLRAITGQSSAGVTSMGADFALASGSFGLIANDGPAPPVKDQLYYLPVIQR